MEGHYIPVNKGLPDAAAISLGAPHSLSSPFSNLLAEMTSVEEVLHGFLRLHTECASRGSSETPFQEVVPGKDAVLNREPEKKRNFRPDKRLPHFAPYGIMALA